ncbi:50S ribosomal protein L15e [Candidatus Woesearchaeota archaeon]|nr:50S ribosomal protein L15e [Candidatus Woesearchaeota archaeon]
MGLYTRLNQTWSNLSKDLERKRFTEWSLEPAVIRVEKPTRLDKARTLGYKAKQGYILARVRVIRGGHERPRPNKKGRKSGKNTPKKVLQLNYQNICERRAAEKFNNCEVLNSYYLGKNGKYYWYEIILLDRAHPVILSDIKTKWVAKGRGRVFRGKTSSARTSRGLRYKGKGSEKTRPGYKAQLKRKHNKKFKYSMKI